MIYAIQAGDFIKLGFSKNPRSRLSSIRTGCPIKCVLLGTMKGTTQDERLLHQKFADLRTHGEWFHAKQPLLDWIKGNMICIAPVRDRIVGEFSMEEAARFLGVGVNRVRELMDSGEIDF